jgi:hypothetical protein
LDPASFASGAAKAIVAGLQADKTQAITQSSQHGQSTSSG